MRNIVTTLFFEAGYQKLLIDTGYQPQGAWDIQALSVALKLDILPVLRLETMAERYLSDCEDVDDWVQAVRNDLQKPELGICGSQVDYCIPLWLICASSGAPGGTSGLPRHAGRRQDSTVQCGLAELSAVGGNPDFDPRGTTHPVSYRVWRSGH